MAKKKDAAGPLPDTPSPPAPAQADDAVSPFPASPAPNDPPAPSTDTTEADRIAAEAFAKS